MAKKDKSTKKVSSKKSVVSKPQNKLEIVPSVEEMEVVTEESTVVEEPEQEYVTKQIPEDVDEFKKDIITNVVKNMVADEGEGILGKINEEHKEEILEMVKERIENIKKINNEKVNTRIDNVFGYLWNGQEMDW